MNGTTAAVLAGGSARGREPGVFVQTIVRRLEDKGAVGRLMKVGTELIFEHSLRTTYGAVRRLRESRSTISRVSVARLKRRLSSSQ